MNIFLRALQKGLLYYVMKMQMDTVESEQDETVSGNRHTSQKTVEISLLGWVSLAAFFFLSSFPAVLVTSLLFISVFPPTIYLN